MKRYSIRELAKLKGEKSHVNLNKSFKRHGILPDANGKFTEADYAKQKEMGAAMDKAKLSAKLADAETEAQGKPSQSAATLTYMKLQRQVKKLDIEVQKAQVELDEMLGKTVKLEEHKDKIIAVQHLMVAWFGQIVDAIATQRKDPELLEYLKKERDRVSSEILEIA